MSEEIRPGRYRHFKGKEYEVLGVARLHVERDGYPRRQDPATVHLCGRGSLMCGQRNCKISVSHKN